MSRIDEILAWLESPAILRMTEKGEIIVMLCVWSEATQSWEKAQAGVELPRDVQIGVHLGRGSVVLPLQVRWPENEKEEAGS